MKVRTRILLLLLVMAGMFYAALVAMRWLDEERFREVAGRRTGDWTRSVIKYLRMQEAPLATMARHFSNLDGLVNAIADEDRDWLASLLNRDTLNAYDANAVWIYSASFAPVYVLTNYEPARAAERPEAREPLAKAFASQRQVHFFLGAPGERGSIEQEKWLELVGTGVRPAWDTEAASEPQGYLFVARLWDRARLDEMAQITGNHFELLSPKDAERRASDPMAKPSALRYSRPLRGLDGSTLAVLSVSNQSPELREMETRIRRWFLALVGISLAGFAILSAALLRSISRPLQQMSRSLETEDLGMIRELETSRSEFGELARLISRFYAQREKLIREMNERIRTEQALRESEERLRHSQKLDALGRLAGGVAHDFNNILTAIIGYSDLLRHSAAEPRDREYARLVGEAGERAAGLTRQLLAFSRKQVLDMRVISLNKLVGDMERMLRRIIGEQIELKTMLEAREASIRADANQMEQVLLNLGVNARDAMADGGRLTIRTANEEIDQKEPGIVAKGRYVVLTVSDTGGGMDEETQSRIFEPFFTTKAKGKGTGLGLAMVYGIVQQSGGGIIVQSELGKGTTFKVFLPLVEDLPETVQPEQREQRAPVADLTVLIVEDEEVVRDYLCAVLDQDGYRILGAASGPEALDTVAGYGRKLDLLITDVILPQMNGKVLAGKLREHHPSLQVLFISGYSASEMTDRGLGDAATELLQKPFTPEALRRRVAQLLKG